MDRADLRLSVAGGAAETVVVVSGELDVSTVDRLTATVNDQLDSGDGHIVLELAGMTFCDSMGLSALVALSRAARGRQRYLLLRNPSPFLTQMLEVTGVREDLNVA